MSSELWAPAFAGARRGGQVQGKSVGIPVAGRLCANKRLVGAAVGAADHAGDPVGDPVHLGSALSRCSEEPEAEELKGVLGCELLRKQEPIEQLNER